MLVVFFNHRLTPRMSAIHCFVPVWHQVLMRMFCRLFACLLSLLVRRCVRSECVWSVFSHHVFLPAQSLFQPVHLAESEIYNIQLSPLHTRITFQSFPILPKTISLDVKLQLYCQIVDTFMLHSPQPQEAYQCLLQTYLWKYPGCQLICFVIVNAKECSGVLFQKFDSFLASVT